MNNVYQLNVNIKSSDRDMYDNITMWSILELFQEASFKHVVDEKIGYQDMLLKNALWVLVGINVNVVDDVCDNVAVKTWQKKKGRAEFIRNYSIESDRKVLVLASSKWCLIDKNTRKILPSSIVQCDISSDYLEVDEPKKLMFDFDLDMVTSTKVTKSLIDHNFHMNNCNYARLIYDVIDIDNKKIKSFEISFLNEAILNDLIEIYRKKIGNDWFVLGKVNSNICFKAKVSLGE